MKRPQSHQIDERAMRIFREALPAPWIPAEQKPDYAKDYLVEIVKGEDLTGAIFFVQLKGVEKPIISRDGKHATFYLETKHATYFLDKVKAVPVFLVLVDVTKKVGYWLFIQEYLRDHLRGAAWRKKKSVAIHLPTANTLTKTETLRKAVEQAREFMAALHPAAVKNALAAKRKQLESLDPRFNVSIDVLGGQEFYTVHAKEPVEGKLTFKGKPKAVSRKIDDLIGKGLPISFKPGEIEITGSPLFAEAFKVGGILRWTQVIDGALSLAAKDVAGQQISTLDGITGKLTGGKDECRFEGELAGSPFYIHITARREGGSGPITLRFDGRKWLGQPLLYLSYFDQLASFFEGVRQCDSIELTCLVRGNRLFGGTIRGTDLRVFKGLAWFVSVIAKAREVAQRLSINPVLNEEIDRDKAEEIEFFHQMLLKGEYRRKIPGARLTWPIPRQGVSTILGTPEPPECTMGKVSVDDQRRAFFGTEVNLGKLVEEYTHLKRITTNKQFERLASKSSGRSVMLVLDTTEQSEQVVRKKTPE